jgi:hypothetical protein
MLDANASREGVLTTVLPELLADDDGTGGAIRFPSS